MPKKNPEKEKETGPEEETKKRKSKGKSKGEGKGKEKAKEETKTEVKMEPKKKIGETAKEKKKKTKPKNLKRLKMKEFRVSGKFMMGSTLQKFQKEVRALSEKRAREKIYQDLGSKHQVRRSRVLITTVEEIP